MRLSRNAAWTGLLPSIAVAQEQHSVLAPHGEVAAQIAMLTWMLLGLAALVLVTVAVATWIALRGPPRLRAMLASQRAVVVGGFVFPVAVLTVLLIAGLHLSGVLRADTPDALKIEVRGEQWWWRVRYPLPAGGVFESANEIRIPVGRPVVFDLTAADVIHSFWIPSLAGKMDMIPGRITSLTLSAERPGVYRGTCAEYCGGPHAWMALSVIAMPAADFDDWLRAAAEPPQLDDVARQGQVLFMRAGCGGCHTIAGTEARGTIGPALTRLASRRMLAAGALPMSEQDIARFIEHGQAIKPGNKMPPFRIFSGSELSLLSAYLMALR
jgi:cytochrome c oxidase subunit 2